MSYETRGIFRKFQKTIVMIGFPVPRIQIPWARKSVRTSWNHDIHRSRIRDTPIQISQGIWRVATLAASFPQACLEPLLPCVDPILTSHASVDL
jgi:hypothetical protein